MVKCEVAKRTLKLYSWGLRYSRFAPRSRALRLTAESGLNREKNKQRSTKDLKSLVDVDALGLAFGVLFGATISVEL
jgi:hypothetical protein